LTGPADERAGAGAPFLSIDTPVTLSGPTIRPESSVTQRSSVPQILGNEGPRFCTSAVAPKERPSYSLGAANFATVARRASRAAARLSTPKISSNRSRSWVLSTSRTFSSSIAPRYL
jgi:hypothetical protein